MDAVEVVDLLNALIIANRDSAEACESAVNALENTDYRTLFTGYAQQHQQFIIQLSELVRTYGGVPAESGDLTSTFQRAWMNIRAALTEGDSAIMDECDRGEEATLALYADILPKNLPEEVKTVVRSQLVDVRIAHDRIHSLNGALAQT